MSGGPHNRRERLRQATVEEIVQVARDLLSEGKSLTLGAVAARMGLSTPALYRYVDNVAALNVLVAHSLYADVVDAMAAIVADYGDDDPAAQMVAAMTIFRAWAHASKAEFVVGFGVHRNAVESSAHNGLDAHPIVRAALAAAPADGVQRFADFFGGIFYRMWQKYPLSRPVKGDLDADFLRAYDQSAPTHGHRLLGADAAYAVWLFELYWAKLLGIVTLEVFGHIEPRLVAADTLFIAVVREMGDDIGTSGEADRLARLCRAVSAAHSAGSGR
ncbi:TetR/AcrR family transcriptional regulator [Nocardia rhizosphaerae]|uniref:TetR/AcrR family transcriptional regulator n=1 Tax=Nocardia rhizosphaerae TaxID=1691571 RepID=A0ABV8LAL6_9NOCA